MSATLHSATDVDAGVRVTSSIYPAPMRVGIVGTGGVARIHGWRAQDLGSTVVAVAGRAIAGAHSLAADLQRPGSVVIQCHDDVNRMLDDSALDVLHVCSPHALHAAHATAALRHGVAVICEKPLATAVDDADAMATLASSTGLTAAVCLTKRYYPMVAELRARIRAGAIGQVQSVSGGFSSWDSAHDTWSWGFDPALGGPSYATTDLGVHWLDLAEHVLDARITDVFARFTTTIPVRHSDEGDRAVTSEDVARVLLTFANGAIGTAVFSGVAAGEPNGCTIIVQGSAGALSWSVSDPETLQHRTASGEQVTITRDPARLDPAAARLTFTPAGHAEGFPEAFRNLIRDVYFAHSGARRPDHPTFDEGARLVRIIRAIQQSAQDGKAVDID